MFLKWRLPVVWKRAPASPPSATPLTTPRPSTPCLSPSLAWPAPALRPDHCSLARCPRGWAAKGGLRAGGPAPLLCTYPLGGSSCLQFSEAQVRKGHLTGLKPVVLVTFQSPVNFRRWKIEQLQIQMEAAPFRSKGGPGAHVEGSWPGEGVGSVQGAPVGSTAWGRDVGRCREIPGGLWPGGHHWETLAA